MSRHKKRTKTMSEKQLDANRKNALLSTGAQTPEGHNRSKYNAMLHNMRGVPGVLPWENKHEFREHSNLLIEEYAPVTTLELRLIYEVAEIEWTLWRGQRYAVQVEKEVRSLIELRYELSQLALYGSRLERSINQRLKRFYKLKEDRERGMRPLTLAIPYAMPPAADAVSGEAAIPPASEVSPEAAASSEAPVMSSDIPFDLFVDREAHRHQADVDLATMGGELPQHLVDYAKGSHSGEGFSTMRQYIPDAPRPEPESQAPQTAASVPVDPAQNAKIKNPSNPVLQGDSSAEMGSFDKTEILRDEAGNPIGHWTFLPASEGQDSGNSSGKPAKKPKKKG